MKIPQEILESMDLQAYQTLAEQLGGMEFVFYCLQDFMPPFGIIESKGATFILTPAQKHDYYMIYDFGIEVVLDEQDDVRKIILCAHVIKSEIIPSETDDFDGATYKHYDGSFTAAFYNI